MFFSEKDVKDLGGNSIATKAHLEEVLVEGHVMAVDEVCKLLEIFVLYDEKMGGGVVAGRFMIGGAKLALPTLSIHQFCSTFELWRGVFWQLSIKQPSLQLLVNQ